VTLPRASDVSARVQTLIAFHEKGDRRATARRLGIDVSQLTGLLSGDWGQFSLDALGALVATYGVSIDWLLALRPEPRPQPRPAARGRDANVEGR
jgi:transcriptional regulator with XRE-family HTH domain